MGAWDVISCRRARDQLFLLPPDAREWLPVRGIWPGGAGGHRRAAYEAVHVVNPSDGQGRPGGFGPGADGGAGAVLLLQGRAVLAGDRDGDLG